MALHASAGIAATKERRIDFFFVEAGIAWSEIKRGQLKEGNVGCGTIFFASRIKS